MAHARRQVATRTSSTANPISTNITLQGGDTVLVVLLKVNGGTNRAGGALVYDNRPLIQANSTQKAVTSPEASAELWYLVNPPLGTKTLVIPNTGGLTVFYNVEAGQAATGFTSEFDGANGGNATSTNPSAGAIVTTVNGDIGFAVVATGAGTWAPSAQTGTVIQNTDDGAHGGGTQYTLQGTLGSFTFSWTFATSDDWGAVAAFFKEVAIVEPPLLPQPVFRSQPILVK